jgi:hypothetical protein
MDAPFPTVVVHGPTSSCSTYRPIQFTLCSRSRSGLSPGWVWIRMVGAERSSLTLCAPGSHGFPYGPCVNPCDRYPGRAFAPQSLACGPGGSFYPRFDHDSARCAGCTKATWRDLIRFRRNVPAISSRVLLGKRGLNGLPYLRWAFS